MAISEQQMREKSHNPTLRDQHPKSHGYARGEFVVADNLPAPYRHGIFATPATNPSWVRSSNGTAGKPGADGHMAFPPDAAKDEKGNIHLTPDVRGIAIKLLDVEGEVLPEAAKRPGEQDFILINSKVFFVKNVPDYLPFFAVVQAIKDGLINPKQPSLVPPEYAERYARVGYALKIANTIKQQAVSSPLQIGYWSATPYKLGAGAMKHAAAPRDVVPPFDPATAADLANVLREAVATQLAGREAVFDFLVQLQVDPVATPIEDPTKEWLEKDSPFLKEATLRLLPQDINSPDRLEADEHQSFSPWHSLVDHRPLGGVNRARRMYGDLARSRNRANSPA